MTEMSDRNSTGGQGKGVSATDQGRLHATERLRVDRREDWTLRSFLA